LSTEGLVAVTRMHGRGRVQVPSEIINDLVLKDGDKIAWYKSSDGTFYMRKVMPARGFSVMKP